MSNVSRMLQNACATLLGLLALFAPVSGAMAACTEKSVISQLWQVPNSERPRTAGRLEVKDHRLAPREVITVRIAAWKVLDDCLDGTAEPTLFLDHLPMTALPTTGRTVWSDGKGGKFVSLSFRLDKPSKGEAAWNELLYRDWEQPVERRVSVGIGVGGAEIVTLPEQVVLTIGRGGPAWAWQALCVAVLSVLLIAFSSRALEDSRSGFMSLSLSRLMLSCWVATTTAVVVVVWRHSQALPSFSDGGLAFMLAASGLGTGFSTWLDTRRKTENTHPSNLFEDLLCDEDGLALHRVQSMVFNVIVLYVVWSDLITYGTVAQVNLSWSGLLGASTLTYLFGRSSEDVAKAVDTDKRPTPPLQALSGTVLEKLNQLRGAATQT